MTTKKIMGGIAELSIDTTAIGLTRGGFTFVVENESREVSADWDKGKVKGRVVLDTIRPKLTVNALEIDATKLKKYYAGLKETTGKITSTFEISDTDYHNLELIGSMLDGSSVKITLKNALCTENISLDIKEKDEVVPQLVFEACYEDGSDEVPYSIEFLAKT